MRPHITPEPPRAAPDAGDGPPRAGRPPAGLQRLGGAPEAPGRARPAPWPRGRSRPTSWSSTTARPSRSTPRAVDLDLRAIGRVEVLHLRRNLGHQRAIAIGLAFVEAERPRCRAVVLMDSDGEDAPEDVPRLVARCEQEGRRKIVFAERTKRSESAALPGLLRPLPGGPPGPDRPLGPGRQLQRDPPRAALLPGGGLGALEPLRGGGLRLAGSPTRRSRPAGPAGSTAGRR